MGEKFVPYTDVVQKIEPQLPLFIVNIPLSFIWEMKSFEITVAAESAHNEYFDLDARFTWYLIGIDINAGAAHTYDILIKHAPIASYYLTIYPNKQITSQYYDEQMDPKLADGKVWLYIKNEDTADHTYKIRLFFLKIPRVVIS